jgi:DNA-binding NarL/FixJ family response regulator
MSRTHPTRSDRGSGSLEERRDELDSLRQYLDDAAAGVGRIVLVRGDAGIGKTALLQAFVEALRPAVNVLWGASDGVSTPQPYGPFEDIAETLGPEFRQLLEADASRGELGRWLLRWMAVGPVRVLVIEDVQWADQATLDLLAFLARRIETLPVLLLVTHRDGADDAPNIDRILGGVATLPVVRQLALQPLSPAGVVRLAGGTGIDAVELHRITAGNPFYVHEVLDTGLSRIPLSVRDAVRARVAQLDERGRRALQVAAILGVRVEPWLLAAVAGEDVLGVDDCVRVGLMTKADGLAFPHELTRAVVLADVPVIHGIALHRRALNALERAGVRDEARLAYHADGAADRAAVLRHAPAAGHRALAMNAVDEAIAQFERALRYTEALDDPADVDLLEPLARARHLSRQRTAAYDAAAKAAALRKEGGDYLATSASLTLLAEVSWWAGHERAASGDGHEVAMAYATLGRLEMLAGRNREGRVDSDRALEIGRRIGDAEATAVALGTIGSLKLDLGDETGWADLLSSAQIAREAHLSWLVDRALHNLGVAAFSARRYGQAREYFQEMLETSERSQIDLCSLDSPMAEIAFVLGDWDAAVARSRTALLASSISSDDRVTTMLLLARIAFRRGDPGWERLLDEVRAFVAGLAFVPEPLEELIVATEAEAAWLADELPSVVARLRAAYEAAVNEGRRAAIGELGLWLWRAGELSALDDRAEEAQLLEVAGHPREARAAWARLSMPYEAAISLAASVDASDVRQAHEALTRLGATAAATKVARRLRELGSPVPRGPRPGTRTNPGGLTEREWEIAQLLARGLSNAEIADRLVLSPKTVGHHVSAVLGKLAVRRRAEVASALSELGVQE